MCDLQSINSKYGHSCIDTEALKTWEDSVGANEESNDISEGGH